MVNIFKWMSTLYISQVGPCRHVFQVMHMFLRKFGWISLKKQRSVSKYKKMNSNWRFKVFMMKPSSRGLKWIYGTHDLKLRRGSYDILKILSAKLEAADRIRPPVICEITPSCKKTTKVFTIMISAKINIEGGALSDNSLLPWSGTPHTHYRVRSFNTDTWVLCSESMNHRLAGRIWQRAVSSHCLKLLRVFCFVSESGHCFVHHVVLLAGGTHFAHRDTDLQPKHGKEQSKDENGTPQSSSEQGQYMWPRIIKRAGPIHVTQKKGGGV
jgi:hypothetical protein